jgi:predicted Zn-dependent protease
MQSFVRTLMAMAFAWACCPVFAQQSSADAARCSAIVVSKPVNFHGQALEEIPDIREPELRLANQLLSSDCQERADQVFAGFVAKHPGNLHSTYYLARRTWMTESVDRARELLEFTLSWAPNFVSAKVLLAGLDLSEGNAQRALQLLKESERLSPNDVWIFINRSRLATGGTPTPELRARLLEMARNEAFPPNVRLYAANASKHVTLGSGDYEESLAGRGRHPHAVHGLRGRDAGHASR